MSAVPFEEHPDGQWEPEDDPTLTFGGRRRRQYFTRASAALLALVTAAVGFYVGIRVEKGQVSSSSATSSPFAGLASRTGAAGAGSRAGSAGSFASRAGASGGFPSGAAGFFGGGGSSDATIGTIQSVGGNAIYVSGTSGNTVKVVLNSSTKMTKSLSVSKKSLHPGDSVVVRGLKNSNGSYTATSVSDSGSSGTSTTGSSSSGSSGSSGVSSLFGGG